MRAAAVKTMRVTIVDRGERLRDRLRDRLDRASKLSCTEHGQPVVAVTIHARENGWFDSLWITCCDTLEQQATAIVKQRC
jgi:hypothetical protein